MATSLSISSGQISISCLNNPKRERLLSSLSLFGYKTLLDIIYMYKV
jgi:hypothetical protein